MLSFLSSHPDLLHVETEHAGVMPDALAELARQEVDLLVINGGDGTLQYVLTEILGNSAFGDRVPMIAPLRAGRTNMSALDLGARKNPLKGTGAPANRQHAPCRDATSAAPHPWGASRHECR